MNLALAEVVKNIRIVMASNFLTLARAGKGSGKRKLSRGGSIETAGFQGGAATTSLSEVVKNINNVTENDIV